ncbi:MAG: VUT family protein [Phycisphaeraceae bacterium]|nr:MAG: VUT family protein [Phycisphaeraceae bacterium]
MSHHAPLPSLQHRYDDLPELSEAVLHNRRERTFLIFSGIFLGTLAMLNILGITRFIKLFEITDDTGETATLWGFKLVFAIAVGVLPYPITFLCTDFICELYGRKRANQVVWTGFLLNIWVVTILWIGGVLPGFEAINPDTGAIAVDEAGRLPVFFEVRTLAFGAVAASMIAYLVAQLVDVHVFHFWKKLTRGRHLWLRNNGSTLVSQLVDTTAVILITHFYARALPIADDHALWPQLLLFIATGYLFKMLCALVDTIPFYLGAFRLARYLRLPPPSAVPHPGGPAAVEAGVG